MRIVDSGPESRFETTACLCRQQFDREPEKHRLVYSRERREYLIFCPSCGFRTHPDSNLQSVKTDWICSNRAGDLHVANLWDARLERLKQESGTAVPPEQNETIV